MYQTDPHVRMVDTVCGMQTLEKYMNQLVELDTVAVADNAAEDNY